MRLFIASVIAVILGCALGIGTIWHHEVRGVVDYFEPKKRTADATHEREASQGVPRAVVVGGPKFDFGTMEFNASADHKFVIQNEGDKPLSLDSPQPTCGKCIQSAFTTAEVPPRGSCDVVITYAARKDGQNFSEGLTLHTNDPTQSMLKLDIVGVVTMGVRALPTDLTLGSVTVTEGSSATIKLLGYRSPHIELTGHSFSNPTTAELFDITTESMSPEEAKKADTYASCGLAVHVTLKPGLPLGRINQTIKFDASTDSAHPVEVPISGEVVGDITMVGKEYKSDMEALLLGVVNRAQGRIAKLHILVKGAHRKDVKITVGEIDPPDVLRATVGEGVPIGEGKAVDFPLTVEIVKNAPSMNRLGNAQGKTARIVLETTHPTTKQIPINVKFATE